ncbi:DUF5060 domain-containing protein [bacterium]|nr:MAG: DUF5060 domain-containing protein [bacterium]
MIFPTPAPLEIRSVLLEKRDIPRYGVAEIRLDLRATYDNPFDSSEIAVDAVVKAPSGKVQMIPGFFTRPYSRKLVAGKEELTPTGPGEWRLRVAPSEIGAYTVTVSARDRTGSISAQPIRFRSMRSKEKGFVRLSPKDRRYFAHDNGQAYYPVGANVCWGGDRGSFDYDEWIPRYGTQGVNYGRLWLGPHWSTFALETNAAGFGRFDLGNAWRIDHTLDLARKQGIYLMLCLDSYNTLRDKDAYPQWEATPLNQANGGPLAKPTEFWTDARMAKVYRDRLRYVVARYGANTHVMAWEFWNEADLTRDFDPKPVAAWHDRMSSQLRDLDPYDHLQSTSFSNSLGFREIDDLPGLDFVQSHTYTANLVREAASLGQMKGREKAYFIGEIGADAGGPRAEDKAGLQVHDSLWAGIANGHSGTAMMWWWDNLIEPNGLYPLFKPAANFVRGIDWPSEGFRPAEISLTYARESDAKGRGDLEFTEGPIGFGEAAYNRPQTLLLRDGKVTGGAPRRSASRTSQPPRTPQLDHVGPSVGPTDHASAARWRRLRMGRRESEGTP